ESPNEKDKIRLQEKFDAIFTQQTDYQFLNLALKRLHADKAELLLVLHRPEIPLHNNLSENDIREYVKRRKVSGSTRSEAGRRCRDTFTSLKKTCRKLGISFWQYLEDRLSGKNSILPLSQLVVQQASAAPG
ncbi:MAG: transposase, partial [Thermodesulfobacteriota bacterium]|nr:transposase [Thermodesulfobacteriota bacterium]